MTVTEAKRRVKVGTVIEAVGHYNPRASGPRTVTKVQTNGFWWVGGQYTDGRKGWTQWPPARLCRDDGPDTITIMFSEGVPGSTFRIEPSKVQR